VISEYEFSMNSWIPMLSHHIFLLVFRISKDVNDTLHYNFDAMRFMSYSIFFTLKLIYFLWL